MPKRYINSADALNTLKHLAYETALNQHDPYVADVFEDIAKNRLETWVDLIPTANVVEPLTDIEQRIFLAAMGREYKICKKSDEENHGIDNINLVRVCREIERKVKKALWTK